MAQKVAILGVGGIGGVFAGYLAKAGQDITLVDQWPENVEAINKKGLTLTAMEEEFTVHPRALHLCDVSSAREQYDVVILAVKSYDTDWCIKFIEPYLAPGGFIVSAQNSINDDRIAALIGWSRVIGCVITLGAGMYEPGHALRTSPFSRHALTLGETSGMVTPRLQEVTEYLKPIGPAKVTTNLWGERWAKLALNCMANAIAGITGLDSTGLREDPKLQRLRVLAGAETVQVGMAWGVNIEPISGIPAQLYVEAMADGAKREELETRMLEGSRQPQNSGRPSLAQDILKGRKTEVEYLNGYVVEKGKAVGVPAPVNQALVEVTKRVESGELKPSSTNLKYLEEVVP